MAEVRYQVDGLPAGCNAHAFLPMPGLTPAGSSHGLVEVFGAPGTEPVPSPAPATRPHQTRNQLERTPSDVAPDFFLPQLGLASTRNMGPGRSIAPGGIHYLPNDSRIPVPVGSILDQPSPVKMGGRKVGGRDSMIWPRTITRWPDLLTRGKRSATNPGTTTPAEDPSAGISRWENGAW